MSFLGCGDERLVIESRFCGENEDYFFQYLLDKVLDFPNIVDLESDANSDAKYKPIDNIGNRDYLQVLAYMFRFDAKTGYYLYPEVEGFDDLKLWMNRGSTYEANVMPRDDISITKHGLKIPADAPDYAGFVAKMKIFGQEFTR